MPIVEDLFDRADLASPFKDKTNGSDEEPDDDDPSVGGGTISLENTERDTAGYVRALLHGTAAEKSIDYAAFRRELERGDRDNWDDLDGDHDLDGDDSISIVSRVSKLELPPSVKPLPEMPFSEAGAVTPRSTTSYFRTTSPPREELLREPERSSLRASQPVGHGLEPQLDPVSDVNPRSKCADESPLVHTSFSRPPMPTSSAIPPSFHERRGTSRGRDQPGIDRTSSTPTSANSHATSSTTRGYFSSSYTPTTMTTTTSTSSIMAEAAAERKSRALQQLSQFLVAEGLPPLPRNVIKAPLPDTVQMALDQGMSHVLGEFRRRGDLIQELVSQLTERDEKELALNRATTTSTKRPMGPPHLSGTSKGTHGGGKVQKGTDGLSHGAARGGQSPRTETAGGGQKGGGATLSFPSMHAENVADANATANQDLRIKYEQIRQKAQRDEAEADLLRKELNRVVERNRREHQRGKESFDTLRTQYQRTGHGALDQMTVEAIGAYERKLADKEAELHALREQSLRERSGLRSSSPTAFDGVGGDYRERSLVSGGGGYEADPTDQFLRLKHTMEQQIYLLQKRLDEKKLQIAKVEEERDLLSLKLINFERAKATGVVPSTAYGLEPSHANSGDGGEGNALASAECPPGVQSAEERTRTRKPYSSTREKIRRDKLNYKLKLFKVDELDAEDCRTLLKEICIRLHLADVTKVVEALDEVARVLHVVPSMQHYIRQVDAIAWRRPVVTTTAAEGRKGTSPERSRAQQNAKGSRLSDCGRGALDDKLAPTSASKPDPSSGNLGTSSVLHKVKDTLNVLEFWSQELDALAHLRDVMERIYKVVKIEPKEVMRSPASTAAADELTDAERLLLEELKRLIAFEANVYRVDRRQAQEAPDSMYSRIAHHFCNLFEVQSLSEAFPKLNELMVFVTEAKAGISRLREALQLPNDLAAGAVLNNAADRILDVSAGRPPRLDRPLSAASKGGLPSDSGSRSPRFQKPFWEGDAEKTSRTSENI